MCVLDTLCVCCACYQLGLGRARLLAYDMMQCGLHDLPLVAISKCAAPTYQV